MDDGLKLENSRGFSAKQSWLTSRERIDWGQIYSAPSDLDPAVCIAPG